MSPGAAKGFYPDPDNPGHERYWNGSEWTEQRRKVKRDRSWLPWAIVAAVAVVILAVNAGSEDEDGASPPAAPEPSFTEPEVAGRCPGIMTTGVPASADFKVTPREEWPAVYVSLFGGEDIVDAVSMDGAPGKDIGMPSIETYRLAAGLDKGETGRVTLALLPIEAEKTELEVSFWGGDERERTIGAGDRLSTCELTVVP